MAGFYDTAKNILGGIGSAYGQAFQTAGTNLGLIKPKVYTPSTSSTYNPPVQSSSSTYSGSDEIAALMRELNNLRYSVSQQPVAPYFDIVSNASKARQAAEGAVNPYYIEKFNNAMAKFGLQKEQATTENQRTQQDIETALKNATEANRITGERTAQDVATNLQNIGTQEQNFQTNEGTAFDQAKRALASNVAQSGLTTSGLGQQQTAEQIQGRNVQSGQQVQSFNVQKKAQELFKTRTIGDLARSNELATTEAGTKKARAVVDLDQYIKGLNLDQSATQQSIEGERLGRISQEQQNQEKLGYLNFISAITNPGQRTAAAQTYGGLY